MSYTDELVARFPDLAAEFLSTTAQDAPTVWATSQAALAPKERRQRAKAMAECIGAQRGHRTVSNARVLRILGSEG